jgi:hypothetical protein
MPSFDLLLQPRIVDPDPDGPIRRLFQLALKVQVECSPGDFQEVKFVFDTGAMYTLMSATRARSIGVRFPAATSRLGMMTAAGGRAGRVHDGELRVRFPQLPGRVVRLYCVFAEDVPPAVPPVFGLNDFLDVFRVALDGTPRAAAPFGRATFEALAD